MIGRLRIAGYKTLEDAETSLGALTVILGPLGSGRSNALEAIRLLGRLASAERLERAFAPPHRGRAAESFRNGPIRLQADIDLNPRIPRALNARLAERERIEGLSGSFTRVAEKRLRYEVAFELSPDSGSLRLSDESLEPLSATGTPRQRRKPFFERDPSHERFVVRLERQGVFRYFGLGRRRTLLSEVTDLVYHPHPAAAREELLGVRRFAFEPSALRAPGSGAPDGPGPRGEDFVAFLTRLASEEADALRRLEEKLAPAGLEQIDLASASGTITLRIRGDRVPLHLAPDGMLRLVALASIFEASSAPTVALFDEPECGLDPASLATLARVLRAATSGRRPATQVILATNSVDLASHLEPATMLACRREPGRGTVLAELPGGPDQLFRRSAIERALTGVEPAVAVAARRRPGKK
jgi:predicted ATPase